MPNDIFKVTARSRGGTFLVENATLNASGTLTLGNVIFATQVGFVGLDHERPGHGQRRGQCGGFAGGRHGRQELLGRRAV